MGLITKLFGTYSERELKSIYPIVDKIEALDGRVPRSDGRGAARQDARIQGAARQRRNARRHSARSLRRRAARPRAACSGLYPYRVQLIGGIVLHQGRIAEMKTGEGKTLVATLPAYLNALDRKRRAHRHRERLPGQARQRVDGQGAPLPRPERGPDRP